ncbi:response regulator transcription factor [Streptomyces sp. NPDC005708]|uniref:response regulator n=1 Tax=Streptomyces sp. NPDC005708 TaxID=3154564 RepID=UPI00340647BE
MGINVVIVDDDAGFRRLATTLPAWRGCTVVAAVPDGKSGIEAVQCLTPDAVLLDVNLPDRDGLAVAQDLRGHHHPIAVILTSTEIGPWTDQELADAGVRAFIPKEALLDADLSALFSS